MAEAIVKEEMTNLHPELSGLTRYPYLRRSNSNTAAYVAIFVDNSLGIAQGSSHWQRQVWKNLFHSLDKFLRTCGSGNLDNHK